MVDDLRGGFRVRCLLDVHRADGNYGPVINGSSIKEEGANNSLDALDASIVEWRTDISFCGVLDFGAICDFGVFV